MKVEFGALIFHPLFEDEIAAELMLVLSGF
jgi:hypothetical protein